LEPYEFECKWIDKNDLWKTADEIRGRYWPEGILPVDTEKIAELVFEVEKVIKIIKSNNLTEFLKNDSDAVLSRVSPTLCKAFGISTDVIEKRVKREGLWPPKL